MRVPIVKGRKMWPLVACFALTGCVHYQTQPIVAERNAAQIEQRSFTDETLHRYIEANLDRTFPGWPLATWNLETLTLAAFYFNPDLAVARAHYESVAAGKRTANQRPNPTIGVSPSYNTTTAVPSPWLVTATFDVPIETAGKRGYRRAQAQHLADAAQFTVASAAWDVRVRLRRALVELWAAQQNQALLQDQERAQEFVVHLLEEEMKAGGIAPAEVSRERIALQQAKLAKLDAESRRAQARTQLAGVIGVPLSALDRISITFEDFDQPPPEPPSGEARRRALLSRTDILCALSDYAASESGLQLEIARQYPDIHIGPGYEYDQGDNKWGLGLNVDLPIFNQNRGPIAEAEARRRESAVKFDALQLRVLAEVEGALAGCENARQKYAAAAELMAQAKKQEHLTEESARAGEVSKQAVAGAKLEVATAALTRLDALLKVQQAAATLENALQSPLELPAALIHTPVEIKSAP